MHQDFNTPKIVFKSSYSVRRLSKFNTIPKDSYQRLTYFVKRYYPSFTQTLQSHPTNSTQTLQSHPTNSTQTLQSHPTNSTQTFQSYPTNSIQTIQSHPTNSTLTPVRKCECSRTSKTQLATCMSLVTEQLFR